MQGKVRSRRIRINGVTGSGLLTAAVLVAGALGAVAAPISYTGSTATQNFDTPTLANTGTSSNWTNSTTTGATVDGTVNGWWAWQNVSAGATPTATAVATYLISTGSSATGALFSYGSAGSADRALGTLVSNSTGVFEYGITLINNSSTTYNSLTIGYTGEQWRNNGNATAQSLTFDYKINAVNAYDSGFTSVSALAFTSPIHTSSSAALDGNAAANRQVLSTTLSGITWAPGQTLFLRWTDINDANNDHGLAIDDFSFNANLLTNSFTWNTGTTWDTSNPNWLNSASATSNFVAGGDANFTNTNVGTVNITNPITAGSVNFTHTANTYTLTGAAVTAGVVTQNGIGGTLLINNTLTATSVGVSNGTFGGSGTINAPVTLASGTTLAPGSASAAAGTLTVGNLSITAIALTFDLGANTAASDNIIAGTLIAGGTNTFTLNNLAAAPGTYTLIDYTGTALANLANFTLANPMLGSNFVYLVNNTANTSLDLLISTTQVGFPQTWSGGGIGTGTAWLTSTNWVNNAIPGPLDPAIFDAAGTGATITINYGGLGGATNNGTGNQAVGSIRLTGGISRTITASAAPGTLTVNGANGEWLANTTASNTLTLQNGSAVNTMTVSLATAVTNNIEVTQSGAAIVVNSVITGPGGIQKTGAGSLTLAGNNNYTGGTTVTAGKLFAGNGTSGSATGTLPVFVNGGFLGSTIAGGTISGLTTVAAAATLIPNDIGVSSANPLAFTGGLTLLSGATANFDFTTALKDLITVSGGLNLPAGGTINISALIGIGVTGTVPLFTFDSQTNFATTTWIPPVGYTVTLAASGTEIDLNIPAPSNLTWVGGDATNPDKWDIATSLNWTGDATTFHDNDLVTFNNSSSHLNVVVDPVGVAPGAMTVASGSYSFSGGPIKGGATLILSGTGTVTLNQTNNTYAGGTQLQNGTLVVMADGSLGAAAGLLTIGGTSGIQPHLIIGATGFSSTRPLDFEGGGSGGGFIDTNGFNASWAPTSQIILNGLFTKAGNGELMIKSSGFTGTNIISVVGGTLTLGDKTSATSNPSGFVTGVPIQLSGSTLQVAASTANNAKIQPVSISANGVNSFILYNTSTSATLSATLAKPLTLDGAGSSFTLDAVNTTSLSTLSLSTLTVSTASIIKTTTTSVYSTRLTFTGAVNDNSNALTFLGGGSATQVTGGTFFNGGGSNSGNWTLGNLAGTDGATVSPNLAATLTTGSITVNPYSQLTIFNGDDSSSWGTPGQTISLSGIGAQLAPIGPAQPSASGAIKLDGLSSNSSSTFTATLVSNILLADTSVIHVTGDTNGNRTLILSGTVAGNGGLIKQGPGKLILSNANNYLGDTTLNTGILVVSNTSGSATGSGSVILNGGTLASGAPNTSSAATGSIAGAVSASGLAAAIIAPGDIGAIGTLTLGSTLSLTANSTLNFDITGAAKDLLSITGILSVTGTPKITLASSGLSGDYILATFAASGLTNSNFDFSLAPAPSGYVWDVESTFIKLAATAGGPVGGGSGSWNNGNNDGLWDTNLTAGSNWNTAIPNASGHIATFADVAAGGTTPGVVNLVTPKTIGGIVLSSTTTGYTLGTAASPALTLQVPSGSATITVNGTAAHTIAAHTIIASNTTINANSGSLTFSNGIENASSTLSFTGPGAVHSAGITSTGVLTVADAGAHNFGNIAGSPGTPHLVGIVNTIGTAAQLSLAGTTSILGNSQIIATSIRQNTLTIGDGTSTSAKLTIPDSSPTFAQNSLVPSGDDSFVSVVKNLTIANSGGFKGTLDLGNNDLIIDYTGGSSPVTSIEAMIKSGYNGGNWLGKGITSSTAAQNTGRFALTVIDNNTIATHFNTFDGVDTTSHQQVIVKFSWVADLDLNGVVNSNDAITFAAHYSEGAFANHQTGDLNYNGVFDSNDAILFAAAYSESLPHLPEPASLGILALGAGALLIKRRRR